MSYRPSATFAAAFTTLSVSEKIDKAVSVADLSLQKGEQKIKEAVKASPTGVDLYARFALAGAVGCAVTHGQFDYLFVRELGAVRMPLACLLACALMFECWLSSRIK